MAKPSRDSLDVSVEIKGLDSAMKALEAAFPKNGKIQQQILHGAIGGAARKSIVPIAKQMALSGDGSGALSEAIKVRVRPKKRRYGQAAGMEITPVRSNKKAILKYIQHYYTNRGKNPGPEVISNGIRHGHLVEFGTKKVGPNPFLWPASERGAGLYRKLFGKELMKRIEQRVKREARKAKK